jgi:hypothetical protein
MRPALRLATLMVRLYVTVHGGLLAARNAGYQERNVGFTPCGVLTLSNYYKFSAALYHKYTSDKSLRDHKDFFVE